MRTDLSVIIPSYNRPDKLLATLKKLSPQLVPGVTVTVIDNCSDPEYEKYCSGAEPGIADAIQQGKILFIRNPYNIGVAANLMRTFEVCKTEWMWLLADDDDISEHAISVIQDAITLNSEEKSVAFIKFSSRGCQAEQGGGYITSLNAMINTLATSKVYFNSFIFTSNGVYRTLYFKKHIQFGYQNLHTYVPHLMMLLNYLNEYNDKRAIYLSDKQIVTYVVPEMGYSYGFVAGLGVGAFKNFGYDLTKKQYQKLEGVFAPHNDYKVAIDLFYYARSHSNMYVARKLYRNYYLQIKPGRTAVAQMAMRTFALLYFFPTLFEKMIDLLSRLSPSLDRHITEIKKRNI